MSPSFSASLKAHRFLHTLNPVSCRVNLRPSLLVLRCRLQSFLLKLKPLVQPPELVSLCCVGADGAPGAALRCCMGNAVASFSFSVFLHVCGFHSCITVMAYWASGAPEAIRARGMRLYTCWSHKGPLWRPCQRVEQTSYLLARLYPRQSIPQTSTMPTTKKWGGAVTGRNGQHVGEGWLKGTGWAAINFVSYICTRRPGTQSLRANYWGDLDSTRPAPELGTIKPTIRERKRENSHVVCNL